MSALAKKIKRAESMHVIDECLEEIAAALALASKRVQELEAEEWDRRFDDMITMDPQ
jgi:hypothetical protein